MDATNAHRPSRGDRWSIWLFITAGTAIVIWTIVGAVMRCVELLSPGSVQVHAEFIDTVVDAPIGEGGAAVPVSLESAVLTVDALPAASVVAGVLGQFALVVTTATIVVCLVLVSHGMLRGEVFSRRNTVLVTAAGLTGLVGVAAVRFFGNMVANGAFARLGDFDDHAVLSIEPFPFVIAAFVVAVVGTAFSIGDRLQRDTTGLV